MIGAAEHMRQILEDSGVYILSGDTPVDWELEAYGAGFAILQQAVEELEQELFLQTAPAERLAQWERLWQAGPSSAGLEDRREMAAQWLAARPGPLTVEQLPGLLLAAGIRGEAQETAEGLVITVEEYLVPEEQAQEKLRKLLPAHLVWSLAAEE